MRRRPVLCETMESWDTALSLCFMAARSWCLAALSDAMVSSSAAESDMRHGVVLGCCLVSSVGGPSSVICPESCKSCTCNGDADSPSEVTVRCSLSDPCMKLAESGCTR